MASSLLALIDDISTVLDDVSTMTKVAAKKTAGVLGDDLALNAQQVGGVRAQRELPVVWAVAKGSLRNKAVLVPAALAVSALAPWAVTPLLMAGGLFLCFEGVEKLAHRGGEAHGPQAAAPEHAAADPALVEGDKIKGAVRTDFILSAEIITIALGTVADEPLATQFAVLAGIALLMTVGVYGLVAGIVKLDDAGAWLVRRPAAAARALGRGILAAAPRLMKLLSVAGTVAMFMVGGGILVHGLPPLHHAVEHFTGGLPGPLAWGVPLLADVAIGVAAGALALAAWRLTAAARRRWAPRTPAP